MRETLREKITLGRKARVLAGYEAGAQARAANGGSPEDSWYAVAPREEASAGFTRMAGMTLDEVEARATDE